MLAFPFYHLIAILNRYYQVTNGKVLEAIQVSR